MGLESIPDRASSSVYDKDGTTSVPKTIREEGNLGVAKGDKIIWVSFPDEDYVRAYKEGEVNIDEDN